VNRPSKVEYYLNIAKVVGSRSPCTRRQLGAILVKNDGIISSGYNGSARGTLNCGKDIPCLKDVHDEAHYVSFEYCPAIHAEQNAILNAGRAGISTIGTTLFLNGGDGQSGRPCHLCRRYCIQAGIKDCWYINKDGKAIYEEVKEWIRLENRWMESKLVYK